MKYIELRRLDGRKTLLEELKERDIYIAADCGGAGTCGKCRVYVENEWKQACRTVISGDVTVGIPDAEEAMKVETGIFKGDIPALGTPGLRDEERSGSQAVSGCAFCIDIGTTTLAAAKVSVETGEILQTATAVNHQRIYGADVVSRIRASIEGHGKKLQQLIAADLQALLQELNYDGKSQIVISGNTAMGHLLAGYDCSGLGSYPFRPVDISLQQKGRAVLLPGISAFAGADLVSGICAAGLDRSEKICAMIDLGTNGEMALGNKEKILVTSAAAGPAFEGGNISCGCAGIPGAVSEVRIAGRLSHTKTIGGIKPCGICGSGVLDAVSQLLLNGFIDKNGLLNEEYFDDGYPLAEGVIFTQKDIREVQMAKAAVRSGLEILACEYGVRIEDVDTLYLCGGFGQKLRIDSACRIGLIPESLKDKTVAAGNTSLAGAVLFACDSRVKDRMNAVAAGSAEIVLAEKKGFNELYMTNMNFG